VILLNILTFNEFCGSSWSDGGMKLRLVSCYGKGCKLISLASLDMSKSKLIRDISNDIGGEASIKGHISLAWDNLSWRHGARTAAFNICCSL